MYSFIIRLKIKFLFINNHKINEQIIFWQINNFFFCEIEQIPNVIFNFIFNFKTIILYANRAQVFFLLVTRHPKHAANSLTFKV